jgi:hypothetical protein
MTSRRIAAILFLSCSSATLNVAFAQSGGAATHFGVSVGGTSSTLTGPDRYPFTKRTIGFSAGGFALVELNRQFALEPGIFVIRKGGKAEESGVTASLTGTLIQVPLLAKVLLGSGTNGGVVPYVYGGPAIAFRASCGWEVTDGSTSISGNCDDAELSVKSTDLSAAFGIGAYIGRLAVDARFDLGLTQLGESSLGGNNIKSQAIVVSVGWVFRPPR